MTDLGLVLLALGGGAFCAVAGAGLGLIGLAVCLTAVITLARRRGWPGEL